MHLISKTLEYAFIFKNVQNYINYPKSTYYLVGSLNLYNTESKIFVQNVCWRNAFLVQDSR